MIKMLIITETIEAVQLYHTSGLCLNRDGLWMGPSLQSQFDNAAMDGTDVVGVTPISSYR